MTPAQFAQKEKIETVFRTDPETASRVAVQCLYRQDIIDAEDHGRFRARIDYKFADPHFAEDE